MIVDLANFCMVLSRFYQHYSNAPIYPDRLNSCASIYLRMEWNMKRINKLPNARIKLVCLNRLPHLRNNGLDLETTIFKMFYTEFDAVYRVWISLDTMTAGVNANQNNSLDILFIYISCDTGGKTYAYAMLLPSMTIIRFSNSSGFSANSFFSFS